MHTKKIGSVVTTMPRRITGVLAALALLNMFCTPLSAEDTHSLFWPPNLAETRVVYVKSIATPKDIGAQPSFFKKLSRWIAGPQIETLARPVSIAIGEGGTIYVCDPAVPAVHVFQPQIKRYSKFTSFGGQNLISPVGVTVTKNSLLFIADSRLGKIFCVDPKGRLIVTIGEDHSLLRPTGLASDRDKLYAVDTAAHKVLIYDLQGQRIGEFGKRGRENGEFNYPTSVALDREGNIYVGDTLNFRIQAFNKNGQHLYSVGQAGDTSGSFSHPKGIAIDSYGHLYVTDGLFDNIQIFNPKREFLMSLGESGHNAGEFWIVSGIAIDETNTIYVADSYNQRLQVFRYIGKD